MMFFFFDTAHNDNLPIHEDKSRGVYVKNLSDFYVASAPEVYEIMKQGGEARKVSSTSPSHPLVVILSRVGSTSCLLFFGPLQS